jgi:hypothetical protein
MNGENVMMKRMIPCLLLALCLSIAHAGYDDADRVIGSGEYIYSVLEWTNGLLVVDGGGGFRISVKNNARLEVLSTSTPLELDVGGIQYISLGGTSHMDYSGGETFGLTLGNDATATLSGGRIDVMQSFQLSGETQHITMICDVYSVNYNETSGLLTGNWLDGNGSFSITLVNIAPFDSTYSNIHFIPEPTTLLLFGMGGLLIRRKR